MVAASADCLTVMTVAVLRVVVAAAWSSVVSGVFGFCNTDNGTCLRLYCLGGVIKGGKESDACLTMNTRGGYYTYVHDSLKIAMKFLKNIHFWTHNISNEFIFVRNDLAHGINKSWTDKFRIDKFGIEIIRRRWTINREIIWTGRCNWDNLPGGLGPPFNPKFVQKYRHFYSNNLIISRIIITKLLLCIPTFFKFNFKYLTSFHYNICKSEANVKKYVYARTERVDNKKNP